MSRYCCLTILLFTLTFIVSCNSCNETSTGIDHDTEAVNQQADASSSDKETVKKELLPEIYISMQIQLVELEYSHKRHEKAAWKKYSNNFDEYRRYIEKIYMDYLDRRREIFENYQVSEVEYKAYPKEPGNKKKILDYLDAHPDIADRLSGVLSKGKGELPY